MQQSSPRDASFRLAWKPRDNNGHVIIEGDHLPGVIRVWYVELYMRLGSRTRYPQGVVRHETTLIDAAHDGTSLRLQCRLEDGVAVDHRITTGRGVITFEVTASNPTSYASDVAWGAPCVIVDDFTGGDKISYLSKCFIFLDGALRRLPVEPWALKGVETPGQVWCPAHVNREDVESHPLSELVPSHGLIGCFSQDETMVMATAWDPYQDLFQGIIACLHADFRINGLYPGETKRMRGRMYVTGADIPALLRRYEQDFPEHRVGSA